MRLIAGAAIGLSLFAGVWGSSAPLAQTDPVPFAYDAAHRPDTLTVMTYNVKGLPWPAAFGRPSALAAIGDRLRAMRARGAQPQIVVLQEAFIGEAQAIAAAAGYRFSALGPARDSVGAPSSIATDPAYLAARSGLRGEADAALLSGGLMILSDYPIVATYVAAFPRVACAGYDCLANKGVMMTRIAVPGLPAPVEILTTHLNAGRKSGTPAAHNVQAYELQIAAIDRFLKDHGRADSARIFAGDFNISGSPRRLGALLALTGRWGIKPATAMGKPVHADKCAIEGAGCTTLPIAENVPLLRATDWQFYASGRDVALTPLSREVPFGPDRQGTMLSDHIGYSVTYAMARAG